MKSSIASLLLILCCQVTFSQELSRITMHGRVVNDSIPIESGLVFNINAKTGTTIDQKGNFSILAQVKDTLVFSSLGFKTKKVVLKKSDITSPFFKIKLPAITTELIEVVVHAKHGPHPEFGNTQKIVDTQYYGDNMSTPVNSVMSPTGTGDPNNMDVIRVYNKIFKNLFKKNPEKADLVSDMSFTGVALQSVSYSFFTNDLKLKEDEIGLFLLFCENDPKSKTFTSPNQQFEIMDFMITENADFKKIATLEK